MPDTNPYAPTDPESSSAVRATAPGVAEGVDDRVPRPPPERREVAAAVTREGFNPLELALAVPIKGRDGVARASRLGGHVKPEKTAAAQHE